MPHEIGDTVRLSTTFTVGGVPTDPTDVSLVIRSPDGTSVTEDYNPGDIVRDSAGVFHLDLVVTLAGIYAWKWEGTGTAAGVDEGTFTVEVSLLGDYSLCTVQEVKDAIETDSDVDDDLIQGYIVAASSAISQRYQREFLGPTGGTRTFSVGRYPGIVDMAPYDLRSGTVILHPEEGGSALVGNSDYMLWPEGGARLGGTYLQIRLSGRLVLNSTLATEFGHARLQVAGDWGCFTGGAIDPVVRLGTARVVAGWLRKSMAELPFGLEEGREIRPDLFVNYAIPAAAHSLLSPWARLGTP
jgi:hypothetical protein